MQGSGDQAGTRALAAGVREGSLERHKKGLYGLPKAAVSDDPPV